MALSGARFVLALLIALCIAGPGWCEKPVETTVCQLKANPPAYNHKIVRVTAFVSHAFEDFTLFDPQCSSWPGVWLEYGGKVNSGTIYCCGVNANRKRANNLVVEGITIPLVDNKQFEEFDRAIQPPFRSNNHGAELRATLIGRFFAGKKLELFKGKPWGGFGHMSCCSLLAIQEVETADTKNHLELDYDPSADQPDISVPGCDFSNLFWLDDYVSLLGWQRETDHGDHRWAFGDPQKVAFESLAQYTKPRTPSMNALTLRREAQGRKIYIWQTESKRVSYMVVVSRPYWLSFYAHDASRVAWTAVAAYKSSCPANSLSAR